MLGLLSILTETVFVFVYLYLHVWHPGTLSLGSLYPGLLKKYSTCMIFTEFLIWGRNQPLGGGGPKTYCKLEPFCQILGSVDLYAFSPRPAGKSTAPPFPGVNASVRIMEVGPAMLRHFNHEWENRWITTSAQNDNLSHKTSKVEEKPIQTRQQ